MWKKNTVPNVIFYQISHEIGKECKNYVIYISSSLENCVIFLPFQKNWRKYKQYEAENQTWNIYCLQILW